MRDHLGRRFLEQLICVSDDEAAAAEVQHGCVLAVFTFQRPHQVAAGHEAHESLSVIDDRPFLSPCHHGIFVGQSLKQAIDRERRGDGRYILLHHLGHKHEMQRTHDVLAHHVIPAPGHLSHRFNEQGG